jgi:hypothetical protein
MAMENEFFHRVDERLLADLKSQMKTEHELEILGEATGFTDKSLLKELLELGLSPETVLAISLVPLVLVAWADGKIDAHERPAIMKAAKDQGITDGSAAARMLKHWLKTKPDRKLANAWIHYIQTMVHEMSDDSSRALREDFVRRTNAMAHASGGILGFGSVSGLEKKMIADLQQAFDV